jgi:hypothetical protein
MKDTLNYLSEETSLKYHEQLKHHQARCEQLEAFDPNKHGEHAMQKMACDLELVKKFYTCIFAGRKGYGLTDPKKQKLREEFVEWERWAPPYADWYSK